MVAAFALTGVDVRFCFLAAVVAEGWSKLQQSEDASFEQWAFTTKVAALVSA
jgi:hypothetical protein